MKMLLIVGSINRSIQYILMNLRGENCTYKSICPTNNSIAAFPIMLVSVNAHMAVHHVKYNQFS